MKLTRVTRAAAEEFNGFAQQTSQAFKPAYLQQHPVPAAPSFQPANTVYQPPPQQQHNYYSQPQPQPGYYQQPQPYYQQQPQPYYQQQQQQQQPQPYYQQQQQQPQPYYQQQPQPEPFSQQEEQGFRPSFVAGPSERLRKAPAAGAPAPDLSSDTRVNDIMSENARRGGLIVIDPDSELVTTNQHGHVVPLGKE